VSALESYRFNHQRDTIYQLCPESHLPLRHNSDIKFIEVTSQANEPKRQEESQEMKVNGVISRELIGHFIAPTPVSSIVLLIFYLEAATSAQLSKASMDFLLKPKINSPTKIALEIRDRTMLLISSSMALWGDNVWPLLLSDLLSKDVPFVNVGLDFKVKVWSHLNPT